jgi:hypothetical protein
MIKVRFISNDSQSRRIGWLLAMLLLGAGPGARAQSYSIDWFTMDGGGGVSSGGSYTLSGTIGQPDAGTSSAGNYALQGGFWPGVLVVPPGEAPAMFIQLATGNVTISWSPATPGFVLEVNDSVSSGSWNPTPSGSTNPVTLAVGAGAKFYRLRKP